ncbi:YheC/YheD family protein [Paenibacillus athensensis]|uniref:Endospore coat-associated protein n=1 Tax=Paenibacillus athensensis TaxID=1967502 RepID=A0A4Y8PW49_9BACL|nr:YheC/YheD family protein [Paenibacillus athensensis]MCD1258862.1 YheC/YheD family protein [Paenibacillus athensensis]
MDVTLHDQGQKPVLAILTVKNDQRQFRGNADNFVDLIRTGQALGADVYVVAAADLSLTAKQVSGYRYNFEKKRWSRELVPAPHVIYNRVPYRKMELLPDVQQTLQAISRSKSLSLFNPSFFNKWTLFEWLNQSRESRPFIPETLQLSSAQELDRMLREHDFVYLKPVKGKAGRGIMRLERRISKGQQTEYLLFVQDDKQMNRFAHSSLDALWQQVSEQRGSKEYIVQQGITLSRFKQRNYDLRALVQKTGRGRWAVTGIGARVAGRRSITTHVPRGGSIDDPLKLLTHAFGASEAKRLLKRVHQTALKLASHIESASGHQLGEMSMDLGIDTSGRIWFFEANSKPMKFDEPHIRQKSLERIIRYSLYLYKKGKRR